MRNYLRNSAISLTGASHTGMLPVIALTVYSGLERRREAGLSAEDGALRFAQTGCTGSGTYGAKRYTAHGGSCPFVG